MRALICCEFSGAVSGAFRARGHSAYSCDHLPTESDPLYHIQGDALHAITRGCYIHSRKSSVPWELIGIHYTCTFFCNSGVRWLYKKNPHGSGHTHERDELRWQKMQDAARELALLWGAAVATGAKVYFENPTMHSYAAMAIEQYFPNWKVGPTQRIQPCDYGHPETKSTGLWLHGLPKLTPTKIVRNEMALLPERERARVHFASPGKDRWKERSRTLKGVAEAMAAQWSA